MNEENARPTIKRSNLFDSCHAKINDIKDRLGVIENRLKYTLAPPQVDATLREAKENQKSAIYSPLELDVLNLEDSIDSIIPMLDELANRIKEY